MRTMSARKRQRGSALLEYAVIVTVFLMLIFGIIDFGRALYTYHYLSNAARDATRWSAVNGTTCNSDGSCNGTGGMNNGTASTTDIKNYVKNNVPSAIDPAKLTTNVNFLNSNLTHRVRQRRTGCSRLYCPSADQLRLQFRNPSRV